MACKYDNSFDSNTHYRVSLGTLEINLLKFFPKFGFSIMSLRIILQNCWGCWGVKAGSEF
jgi:hypothetical protein